MNKRISTIKLARKWYLKGTINYLCNAISLTAKHLGELDKLEIEEMLRDISSMIEHYYSIEAYYGVPDDFFTIKSDMAFHNFAMVQKRIEILDSLEKKYA